MKKPPIEIMAGKQHKTTVIGRIYFSCYDEIMEI